MKHLVALLFLICTTISYSQASYDDFEVSTELNRTIGPVNSPEAASFAKYGNIPVSLYTGTPQVSVPIYVHQGRELNLPISLTYDASGIKVEQEASIVGLGWNLNVGGRVSRIVNGFPDDYESFGTSDTYHTIWNDPLRDQMLDYIEENTVFGSPAEARAYLQFISDVNENRFDAQPDYFTFNALGLSDTFVIDVSDTTDDRKPKALDNPRLKVDCFKIPTTTLTAVSSIPKWEVTLDDGTILEFDKQEITRSEDEDEGVKSNYGTKKKYVSSWYLTKITSPLGKDVYEFNYSATAIEWERISTSANITQVRNVVNPPTGVSGLTEVMGYNSVKNWLTQYNLESITHNGEIIATFTHGSRTDIGAPTRVDNITIYQDHTANIEYKSFDFNYSYFKNATSTTVTAANRAKIRLKLDDVDIKDSQGNVENSYSFNYFNQFGMPLLSSNGQDYYGYYNGKNTNSELYPEAPVATGITDGGDRSVNFTYAKRGTLSKITYPTGGYSEFEYESNMSSYTTEVEQTAVYIFDLSASLTVAGGATGQGWYDTDSQCSTPGCIDTYLEIGSPPIVQSQVFNIASQRTLLLQLSLLGTAANNYGKHVLIFKRSDLSSCTGSPSPASLDLDEVISGDGGYLIPSEDVVYHNITAGPDYVIEDEPITFDAGCYQVLIVNPEAGSSYQLYLGEWVASSGTTGGVTTQSPKAGIRIKTIKDYTDTGVLAAQKDYSYGDGTVISQPLYSFYRDDWIPMPDGTTQQHQVLYRQSHVNNTQGPHIGYESVTETSVDYVTPANNASTYYRFNTEHWGSYFTGAFTYYINQKQTANNYAVNFELGKQNRTASKGDVTTSGTTQYIDKYINETYYDSRQFYKNQGIYLIQNEVKRDQFYQLVYDSDDDEYSWSYVQGVLQASFGGVPVYNHPDGACSGPECDSQLGRLEFNITSAYGKAGYTTEQRSLEVGTIINTGDYNQGKSEITQFEYFNDPAASPYNFLLKEATTTKSGGEVLKKEVFYPENYPTQYATLITNNMVGIPIETITSSVDNTSLPAVETVLSKRKTLFSGKLPDKVQFAKGTNTLEDRILLKEYRNNNLVELQQPDGTEVSYIWGYDNRYIVAKVVGAKYSDFESLLGLSELSPLTGALSSAQELSLRNLSDVMVTTYEYNPMIGVTKMTDERGYSMFYEYDDFHRLVRVKDQDGNLLQENEYSLRENN